MKLLNLRKKIDLIDDKIAALLGKRKRIVKELAKSKKKDGLPTSDFRREREIIKRLGKKFNNLDKKMLAKIYKIIFHYSKKEMEK